MGLWGIDTVIAIDLISFALAFIVLLFFIPIPKTKSEQNQESVLKNAAEGIRRLKYDPGSFHLMLFLAARNSFQFFTIPVGYFLGGLLVDQAFELIMAMQETDGLLVKLFGYGKGSGSAFLFAVLWLAGIGVCLIFRADKHIWKLESN